MFKIIVFSLFFFNCRYLLHNIYCFYFWVNSVISPNTTKKTIHLFSCMHYSISKFGSKPFIHSGLFWIPKCLPRTRLYIYWKLFIRDWFVEMQLVSHKATLSVTSMLCSLQQKNPTYDSCTCSCTILIIVIVQGSHNVPHIQWLTCYWRVYCYIKSALRREWVFPVKMSVLKPFLKGALVLKSFCFFQSR